MKNILTVLLLCGAYSCANAPSSPDNSATEHPQQAKPGTRSQSDPSIARTWVATGITFNGVADPNFDPARRVELVMREDGTYTMSGAGNAVEGTWRQEGSTELHLTDKITGSLQRFGISKLDEQQLVVKLLDEMNAEVLLHYRAEQGPAVAR